MLARLLNVLGLEPAAVAHLAGISESHLRTVLDGDAAPCGELLRQLAPVLGLNASDMFAIADMPVPEDLAPLEPLGTTDVDGVLYYTADIPSDARNQVLAAARAMPRAPRRAQEPRQAAYQRPPGPGAVLVRLLANRNLRYSKAAKALYHLTLGQVYLSGSTIPYLAGVASDKLPPDFVVGCAGVVNQPIPVMAALAGIALPEPPPPLHPDAQVLAELIWECRRLTRDQVAELSASARVMYDRKPNTA